ncbi:MAG: nitrous oxide reductase accessory protein NosL [Gemmatimonadota bacterium]|nr:nitrous oxide reductase accessory protein NosL [Gemmatimonadota bacterium]MDH5758922.1 nitrous oxide reductase accessory protein NosL [Gemmatimonadota bacterium]
MMSKRSRILVLVSALALGLMYVLPVWKIDLEAPQYPEGLGMRIQVNTIVGVKKHDLDNINNLNHYIGMKRIVPESIPELAVMPVIVAVLMALGVFVALVGRRWLLYTWMALFLSISAVGMVDFWRWEYDYGHNLDDEHAIIKIPGMSYQPPLIGSRQILNFKAHSWPGGGGWAAILAGMVGFGVAVSEWRRVRGKSGGEGSAPTTGGASGGGATAAGLAGAVLLAATTGCGEPGPRPLVAGTDQCGQCLMTVADDGHGAELVTTTGKVYTFDSVECMVAYRTHGVGDEKIHSVWVTDFSNPEVLVDATEAFFLVSPTLASPMGLGITAFALRQDRDGAVHAFGGTPRDWAGVQELVMAEWPEGSPPMGHGGHTASMAPAPSSPGG